MKTFEELRIAEPILRAIQELGYEAPMPVQEEVIPILLEGKDDVIALAQTGMGKTAAYGLPLLQRVVVEDTYPQALVLCPTRELCLQIADDLKDYSKYITRLRVLPVYGGSSIESQINMLQKGVHILVATPGRLIDLMRRKKVDLSGVSNVVLDEADEMLDMGFTDSINAIFDALPAERHTLLFSATMPKGIASIAKQYMHAPKEIVIGRKNEGNQNIRDIYYMVRAQDKYLALKRIVDYYPNIYGIVFCRTRKETQEIADKLIRDGYNADALHGELSQSQRDYVMQKFRIRHLQLLVATDVAARGLDVDDLTHVINYGLPDDVESYTHRRGRTGRAGKTGISICICHVREKRKIRDIESVINKRFEAGKVPTGKEVCTKQLFNFMDEIERVKVDEEEIANLMPQIFRKLDWLDKEDIIKRIVSLEFNRMIEYYKNNGDIQALDDEPKTRKAKNETPKKAKKETENNNGYTHLRLNLGGIDGLGPDSLIKLVYQQVGGGIRMRHIEVKKLYSTFDVLNAEAERVISGFRVLHVGNRKVSVEAITGNPKRKSRRAEYPKGKGRKKKY